MLNILQPGMVHIGWFDWNMVSMIDVLLFRRVHGAQITVSSIGDVKDYVVVGAVVEGEGTSEGWKFPPLGSLNDLVEGQDVPL